MKKLLLLICACVTTFFAVAQKEESVDPKAKALLDKALGVMENKKGMEIQFTIKVDNVRDSKSESFKGSAILKGEKFKMSLKDVDTYFDGKTQAVHMVKEKEVTITTPDKEDLKDINPLLLMKSYKTDYKMRYMGTSTVNGKVCEEVELYPNDLNSPYSIIHLIFEKNTLLLENIALRGKGGIHTYFNVTKIIPKEFKDADFVFDAKQHPGVEVVNLQ
jgi:negative regulator of sigma E activity